MDVFSPFYENDGSINYRAALQQCALLKNQYQEGNEYVLNVVSKLDPVVEVLGRKDDYPDWRVRLETAPRWLALRQGGQVWVWIAGTYSAAQWLGNATTFTGDGPITFTCPTRGATFWLRGAEQILAAIRGQIGAGDLAVNVTGHSLGGATAWYLGMQLKEVFLRKRINVLTYGCPRTCIGPLSSICDAPDFAGHVQDLADVVVHLPPTLRIRDWQQSGQINVIRIDGTLADDDANAGEVDFFPWSMDRFLPHQIRTYYDSLKARYDRAGQSPLTQAVLIASGYVSAPPPATSVPRVTPALPPLLEWMPSYFPGVGGSSMAGPYKYQVFWNWGSKGWSEVIYSNSYYTLLDPATGEPSPNPNSPLAQLIKARANMTIGLNGTVDLGYPTAVYYRVSDILLPNKSFGGGIPESMQAIHAGTGGTPAFLTGDRKNYPYFTATVNGFGHRSFKMKGSPEEWVKGNISIRYGVEPASMKPKSLAWKNLIQSGIWNALVYVPDAGVNITGASIDANGNLNVVAVGSYAINQMVKVKGLRGSGTRGLNGRTRIKDILTNGTLVLAKKMCSRCIFDPENKGQLFKLTPTVAALNNLRFTGWSTGKLGRAFDPERGSRVCCAR